MSVFTQGNIMQSFVVKAGTTGTIPAANADLLSSMADSQVLAVGTPTAYQGTFPNGTGNSEVVIQAAAGAGSMSSFRLVQKVLDPTGNAILNYGPLVKINPVGTATLTQALTRTYQAPTEQLYYIGYNGTNGSLDVSQSNEFMLTIAYDHDDMMWSEQKLRNAYDYYSPAPTQQGLAMSMASQINYKEQLGVLNGTGKMVIADMLAQAATATALDTTASLAVANGSTTITASQPQTTNWAIGTVIRIGTAATAATDPVYVITGITSNTVATINMPYQGPTNATVATGNVRTLTGITNWGLRITGQPLTFTRDFFKYNKVKFHFDLKGFGATAYDRPGIYSLPGTGATNSKESYKGVGSWQEVSEMESFSFGNEGALNRMVIPIPPVRGYTSSAVNYDVTSLFSADYSLTGASSSITGNAPMRVQQFIFTPNPTSAVRTSLNSQLGTLLGISI